MKKLWNTIKEIIITYLLEYLVLLIILMGYTYITKNDITNNEELITRIMMISITLVTIPITIYLYKHFKRKESKIKIDKLLVMLPLGIGISLFYNMLTINYVEGKELIKLSLPIIILYSGIIGPIFEEILFRYTCYNKARKEFPEKTAILLAVTIFAILHSGIIAILYGFILGLILIYVYRKYDNIMYPIIVHISANITSIFLTKPNIYLLIIGAILLIISITYIKRTKH